MRWHRTGVKCLPANKLKAANGNGIHDWHAEVLAMRAFNHYLLSECRALTESADHDSFALQRTPGSAQPFAIRDGVRLYMYASEAPCTSPPTPAPSAHRHHLL